jgi:hypothetical protein
MPEPTGYDRKLFGSKNGFNPNTAWNTTGRTITPVASSKAADNRGYCLAMTCRWIKLALQTGIEHSSKVMDGRELLHISIVQSGYLSIIKHVNTGPTSLTDRENIVYEQSGLKKIWCKSGDDAISALGPASADCDGGDMYFELGIPFHSVGLCLSLARRTTFYFDPNHGLYEYPGEGMRIVFKHMIEAYGARPDGTDIDFTYLKLK